jgi:dipeptidyl-peptidase 9
LLPAGDSLYIVNTDSLPALSKELVSPHKGTRIDPKFSTDGTLVSFIRNNDLWVQDIATLAESRLTLANPTDSPKTRKYSGVAEYIIQEEFDRFTGYWWSPKSNGRKHSILYVDVDETELPVYNITEPGIRGSVDEFIYPLVGEKNAAVDLAIVDIDTSDVRGIHSSLDSHSCRRYTNRSLFSP